MPIEYREAGSIRIKKESPPHYEQLTEFQIWFFFYLIKFDEAPVNLNGVTKNMCLGVKMNLDIENFVEEQEKLRKEAAQLHNCGLFDIKARQNANQYVLSELGELYLFKEILGPIIKYKQKKQAIQIIKYIRAKGDDELSSRVEEYISAIDLESPLQSFKILCEKILKNAMPWLNALKEIHEVVKLGISDSNLDPSIGTGS